MLQLTTLVITLHLINHGVEVIYLYLYVYIVEKRLISRLNLMILLLFIICWYCWSLVS
jgi:hypothetical protein